MNLFSRLAQSWLKGYEPMQYWNTRKNPNADIGEEQFRVAFDINYVRRNISGSERILELGPGIGRTFPAFSPGTNVSTLDISQIYQDQLASVADSFQLRLEQSFLPSTLEPYPFSDEAFDVGVCFQVFIHQPPDVFAHNFSEMARVCRRTIVSVGLHTNTSDHKKARGRHVFNHDYIREAAKHQRILSNVLVKDGVLYFVLHNDSQGLWSQQQD